MIRALKLVVVLICLSALAWAYGAPDAGAASSCRTVPPVKYNVTTQQGQVLVAVTMDKYFCWDGYSVTYAPPARVTASVTELGRARGYAYKGLLKSSDAFFAYGGSDRGGHVSRRQPKIVRCTESTGCYRLSTPTLRIFAYNNGTAAKPN